MRSLHEKEALASIWACERLEEYVLGIWFTLETDHESFFPLLTTTDLPKMPHSNTALPPSNDAIRPRRLARPWEMSADALSRVPVNSPHTSDIQFTEGPSRNHRSS